MKKIEFGQAVQLLANVGVIAGIVFLAIELQQNNELMGAEARFNQMAARIESYTLQVTEPELTEILVRDRKGQALTEVEELRVQAYWTRVFSVLEWVHSELPSDQAWVVASPSPRRKECP